ncbi:MAG TPA: hypothetical protein VJT71_06595 [Pyrinomonadaceae bacterium]|nr:hypothetical protein [Pyrinomonadaceae bacterium]
MDQLIGELGSGAGPHECVVQEYFGSIVHPAPDDGIHDRANAAVHELRNSWGPTADPHWVNDVLPGRGQQPNESEYDGYFALFRRAGFWGYVRVRVPETDTPENAYLRLVFGVLRDTTTRPN